MEYTFEDHAEHGPGYYDRTYEQPGGAFVGFAWVSLINAFLALLFLSLR